MVPTVVKREMLFGRTAKESDDGDAAVFTVGTNVIGSGSGVVIN